MEVQKFSKYGLVTSTLQPYNVSTWNSSCLLGIQSSRFPRSFPITIQYHFSSSFSELHVQTIV